MFTASAITRNFTNIVPRYVTLPSIGLDISDTSIKYIALDRPNRAGLRPLQDWGSIDIPEGVLERGQIRNPERLGQAMAECQARTGAKFARVSLPEERAYLFETDIKRAASKNEIKSLLEFKLTENVPIPAQNVYFDYSVVGDATNERQAHVAVTAYDKETIEAYYHSCVQAGFTPTAFEVEAQAMARAVVAPDASGATMLVDFGKTRTGVGIVYKNVLFYTSTVDVGGFDLSTALRTIFGSDTPEAELTSYKNVHGLLHSQEHPEALSALLPVLDQVEGELRNRMRYWHSRNDVEGERRVSQVLLCGGSSNLRGLTAHLQNALGVPVRLANVWDQVYSFAEEMPPIDFRHSLGYATAIGLALGDNDVSV
jgi:type IV pilus assembly protein PilM